MLSAPIVAIALLATALGLTSCATDVCTTVGWSNVLNVEIDGDAASATRVQVCVSADCSPVDEHDLAAPLGSVSLERQHAGVWAFGVGMTQPERVTVRTLGPAGEVRSETEVTPEWARVGGDERCGGPAEATVTVKQ